MTCEGHRDARACPRRARRTTGHRQKVQRTRAVWPAEPKTVAFVDIVPATLAWETSLKCVFGAGAGRRGPHLLNDTGN